MKNRSDPYATLKTVAIVAVFFAVPFACLWASLILWVMGSPSLEAGGLRAASPLAA
jgi:hypothetical protein